MINIKWIYDEHDCETCGYTAAEGAIVTGDVALHLEPVAHCYNSSHYGPAEVYRAIIEALGHPINEDHQ